jgi:hypothetical protein
VGATYNRNTVVILSVLGGVLVTVLGLVLSGTLAVEAGKTSAMSSKRYSDQEVNDTRDWWNPDRQDQARPVGPEVTPGEQPGDEPARPDAPYRPDYSQPRTVEAEQVAAPYTEPNLAIRGKIFFQVPGGVAECSGTVVHSPSGNVVWTAAHCLHGGKGSDFYTRVTFVPGYDGTKATRAEREPFGRWPARQIEVSPQWTRDADPERDSIASPFDFGAFEVDPPGSQTLEEAVGAGMDILFNAPRHLRVESYGYPGDTPYDGTVLYTCASPTTDFRNPGWPRPDMLWMGCTMTSGSSGGGWFAEVEGRTYLVSNVSLGVTTPTSRTMTGPYLGDDAKTLYDKFA